jgi:hypothetical protein
LFGSASAALLGAHADAEVTSARGATPRGTANACIFVNLNGGPSHMDTFDPKDGPWNPADVDIRDYSNGLRLSNLGLSEADGAAE